MAIKFIDKSKVEDMNDIQREIEIMQMIEHPYATQGSNSRLTDPREP